MPPRIRIGIVGWNYPEWRGKIYAPKAKPPEFLTQYATHFPIVEAASGHYGMPKTEVVAKWAEAVPGGFELSVKVPEWILQKEADDDLPKVLGVLLTHLAPLADAGKLGTVVAQFAPFYRRDKRAAHFAAFVAALPKGPRWAIELRHDSWWHEDTYSLLRDAGVTLVWSALGDGFRTPPVLTTRRLYLRLFGDRVLEEPYDKVRRDASDELQHWANEVQRVGDNVDQVDILVSKFLEGYAPATATKLAEMMGIDARPVPSGPPRGQTTLSFD